MHQKMIRWVAASCFALALTACGPTELQEEAPVATDEVEQGIGQTPACLSTTTIVGYIQSRTTWATACGRCAATAGGGFGLPGQYSERCCQEPRSGDGPVTCGSWVYIKPVCSACDPA